MAKKNLKKDKKYETFDEEHPVHDEIKGLFTLSIVILMILSLWSFASDHISYNWLGVIGYAIGWGLQFTLGIGSYLLIAYLTWIGIQQLLGHTIHYSSYKKISFSVLLVSVCILLNLIEDSFPALDNFFSATVYSQYATHPLPFSSREIYYHLGGVPLYYVYRDLPIISLHQLLNKVGVTIVFSSITLASLLVLTQIRLKDLFKKVTSIAWFLHAKRSDHEINVIEKKDRWKFLHLFTPSTWKQWFIRRPKLTEEETNPPQPTEEPPPCKPPVEPKFVDAPPSMFTIPDTAPQEQSLPPPSPLTLKPSIYNEDYSNYRLPPSSLLTDAKKTSQNTLKRDLKRQAQILEETLLSFGIEAKVGQINCGPTIASFELHPSVGVKVQRIKALENDIALNMKAKSIRIIAPIPGKAAVGIEVPNPQPSEVGFKEMLSAYQGASKKISIPLLLGKAVNGEPVIGDLTKMPHCIIAGATGSGKSVCINSIVMSILMNAKPDEIKMVIIDPKKVELTNYSMLPHMIAPVITEPTGAYQALSWLVKEMEWRYELCRHSGVRNIETFNKRRTNKEQDAKVAKRLGCEVPKKLPYIVGIIDELADLMMVSSADIETPAARIAQMARAVGIHLILATQRPSREVITGLIKANFPTRISFKVASKINSQIILDDTGAEMLLGNGDMLYLPPGTSHCIRAQGAFVRDDDINRVVEYAKGQASTKYLIDSFDDLPSEETSESCAGGYANVDTLFDQAKEIILNTGNASTTFLQRKLKIGYARAASLMDQLEDHHIVSPAEGSKPRKILVRNSLEDE